MLMKKKHIITISGKPGSGKSSTADKVAELLGYTRHSSGDMVRNFLKKSHMSLEEYNERAEDNHSLDAGVDEQLRELRDQTDIIVDSRLGFYWIPESFKVYLDLNLDVATARIFKDVVSNASRSGEGGDHSLSSVARSVKERMDNEQSRFRSMYNVDPYNPRNFDLVIDTSRHTPQSVALAVFDTYKEWLNSDTWEKRHSAVPLGFSLE
jgi:cytidylate kinase